MTSMTFRREPALRPCAAMEGRPPTMPYVQYFGHKAVATNLATMPR